jgi:DNA anti-recombination protein RmuC
MAADHSHGDSPMPVTAKLSRKFYDTFGDEIANELVEWFNQVDATYRADLLQLNELNFDRFEAKLDQRLAQLETKVERELAQFKAEVDRRFEQLDAKLGQGITELRSEFKQGIAELRGELRAEFHSGLAASEAKLIRWMFVFWAGTFVPLAGFVVALML